jgi:hypothetical protein
VPAFSDGEVWLVEAYYDTHLQQWVTSTCQRTKRASAASDDLQALRVDNWKTSCWARSGTSGQANRRSSYVRRPRGLTWVIADAVHTHRYPGPFFIRRLRTRSLRSDNGRSTGDQSQPDSCLVFVRRFHPRLAAAWLECLIHFPVRRV